MPNFVNIYRQLYTDTRPRLRLVLLWFIAAVVIGGLYFFVDPTLLEKILVMFDDKFGPDPSLNFDLAMGIFLNNLQVSALAVFGGLLIGLGPFVAVLGNGFILGYIIISVAQLAPGNTWAALGFLALGLLPHGIIEIPVFLFAAALGLKLGLDWLKQENDGKRLTVLKDGFKTALLGIPVIIILLFIAALIEVYGTGNLLEKLTF